MISDRHAKRGKWGIAPARRALLAGFLLSASYVSAPQAHAQMLTSINPATTRSDSRVLAWLRNLGTAAQKAVDTPVTQTIWPQDVVVFGKTSYLASGPDICPGTGHAGCIILAPQTRTIEAEMHPLGNEKAPFRAQLQIVATQTGQATLRLERNLDSGAVLSARQH